MIPRRLLPALRQRLKEMPAVAVLGPRQVGKTTLALELGGVGLDGAGLLQLARAKLEPAGIHNCVYLDLESEADRAKLNEPELYLGGLLDRLVILDEVHRAPGLFPVLRGLIDRARRSGRRNGLYLLLGSASVDLLRQSGETLAGRIGYFELTGLDVLEVATAATPTAAIPATAEQLWIRGGFPDSFLSPTDRTSHLWRQDFIRTYLERDIPQFGPRIAAETLRRFWTMLAHYQGGLLNTAALARGLGVDVKTAGRYIDLLVDLLLVRRLPAWSANVGKRLVRTPKVYLRDSGILHALLGLGDREAVLSHPCAGPSWEGFVIENLLSVAGPSVEPFFYRSSGGAEVDLLLRFPQGALWAIEVKRSLKPTPRRGFHAACADLQPAQRCIVYAGDTVFPVAPGVEAVPLAELARRVLSAGL